MAKRGPKGYNDTKIVEVLRAVEAAQAQGQTIAQALLEHDISEQTYFKWKRTYGAIDIKEVKRLREIEKENARLKKLVAELGLDNAAGLWTGGAAVRKDAKEASIRAVSGEPGCARWR